MFLTALLWVVAFIGMLLFFPLHLAHYALCKLLGVRSLVSREGRSPPRERPTTFDDPARSVSDVLLTPRGLKYIVHTRIMRALPRAQAHAGPTLRRVRDVILLHGAYTDSTLWYSIMPHLCSLGYNVYSVDLPGFGASEYLPALLDLPVQDLADELGSFLNEYLKRHGLRRVAVVGYSFGGFVTMLGMKHPACRSRICRALLVAPAGVYPLGSRWSHLHAVVFRLKMLSLFAHDLQNQGENLVMRFFETGLFGSRWLVPMMPTLLRFGRPCRVVGGSWDDIFTVDHGFLLQEVTKGAIRYDGCPLSGHFLHGKQTMDEYILRSFRRLMAPGRPAGGRRAQELRRSALGRLADCIDELNEEDHSIGVEGDVYYQKVERYKVEMCAASQECFRVARQGARRARRPANSKRKAGPA